MNKLAISLLIAGTAMVATPVMAQDNAGSTGPRVEAITGYDITRAGSDSDDDVNSNDDESIDGLLYGVGVGYDFAVGGAVVGVEGEFTDSTAKVGNDRGDLENFGFGRVEQGRDFYVGARAGILATPKTLVYAKAGYTNTKLNILANRGNTETDNDFTLSGYRLGAGVEQTFGQTSFGNAFGKLEYRYSNYSKADLDINDNQLNANYDIDTDRHQIVASVGVRF